MLCCLASLQLHTVCGNTPGAHPESPPPTPRLAPLHAQPGDHVRCMCALPGIARMMMSTAPSPCSPAAGICPNALLRPPTFRPLSPCCAPSTCLPSNATYTTLSVGSAGTGHTRERAAARRQRRVACAAHAPATAGRVLALCITCPAPCPPGCKALQYLSGCSAHAGAGTIPLQPTHVHGCPKRLRAPSPPPPSPWPAPGPSCAPRRCLPTSTQIVSALALQQPASSMFAWHDFCESRV